MGEVVPASGGEILGKGRHPDHVPGDLVHGVSGTPLQTLAGVAMQFGSGVISTIHVLPFFPGSPRTGVFRS